jgi:hypothetical protein
VRTAVDAATRVPFVRMSSQTVYELIGYLGSALIVISLAMSSIIRLRLINLAGSLVFTLYGALIGSIPVVITNVIITGLNLWYLRKELTTRAALRVVSVERDDPFLDAFLDTYRSDIAGYVEPSVLSAPTDVRFVMLRDATPAGVFLAVDDGDGNLRILLDYVAPRYRDLKVGALLYQDDARRFSDLGYGTLRVEHPHQRQRSYLAAMGFAVEGDAMVRHKVPR